MEMDIEGEPPRPIKAGELFVVPKVVVHRPRQTKRSRFY
ncbi:MAG: hypothetical protein PGN28_20880 [Agrobacterium cavarae]